jgi:hypothetical protein
VVRRNFSLILGKFYSLPVTDPTIGAIALTDQPQRQKPYVT